MKRKLPVNVSIAEVVVGITICLVLMGSGVWGFYELFWRGWESKFFVDRSDIKFLGSIILPMLCALTIFFGLGKIGNFLLLCFCEPPDSPHDILAKLINDDLIRMRDVNKEREKEDPIVLSEKKSFTLTKEDPTTGISYFEKESDITEFIKGYHGQEAEFIDSDYWQSRYFYGEKNLRWSFDIFTIDVSNSYLSIGELTSFIEKRFPKESLDNLELRILKKGDYRVELIVRKNEEIPVLRWRSLGREKKRDPDGFTRFLIPFNNESRFIWARAKDGTRVIRRAYKGEMQDMSLVPHDYGPGGPIGFY